MAASPRPSPTALHDRAADDLRFIRETMQRAVAFTALSGFGFILVGLGAIATAATTSRIDSPTARLLLWLCDALLSVAVGSAMTAIKARRAGQFAWRGPLRKFAASLAPALVAGAALTAVLAGRGDFDDLPCVWLLCYGAGLAAAGAFSVRVVPVMGWSFVAVGLSAAAFGPRGGEVAMLLGFGVLHVAFGAVIMRRYGG